MSVTVSQIVGRSLRFIQVIDARQPVKASDVETAILALNAMVRRWEADGISLGWVPVENPSDELSVPEEAEQCVAANLAVLLAPEYGVSVNPVVASMATQGMNDIMRDQQVATPIRPILNAPIPSEYRSNTINGSSWYNG